LLRFLRTTTFGVIAHALEGRKGLNIG